MSSAPTGKWSISLGKKEDLTDALAFTPSPNGSLLILGRSRTTSSVAAGGIIGGEAQPPFKIFIEKRQASGKLERRTEVQYDPLFGYTADIRPQFAISNDGSFYVARGGKSKPANRSL